MRVGGKGPFQSLNPFPIFLQICAILKHYQENTMNSIGIHKSIFLRKNNHRSKNIMNNFSPFFFSSEVYVLLYKYYTVHTYRHHEENIELER